MHCGLESIPWYAAKVCPLGHGRLKECIVDSLHDHINHAEPSSFSLSGKRFPVHVELLTHCWCYANGYTHSRQPLGFQYRIGVCKHAVYMYTCAINWGGLSAVDIAYGWKVKAMFFLGSNTINPISSI